MTRSGGDAGCYHEREKFRIVALMTMRTEPLRGAGSRIGVTLARFACGLACLPAFAAASALGDVLERSPAGPPGGIIDAPTSVADFSRGGGAVGFGQLAFNERQRVRLERDLDLDPIGPGPEDVPAGTVVSSHMIFLNVADGAVGTSELVTWTFGGRILGVMSDFFGQLEAASNAELGAPDTQYQAPFRARGMENDDDYAFKDNQIAVFMQVAQPGDWIRVITADPAVAAVSAPR